MNTIDQVAYAKPAADPLVFDDTIGLFQSGLSPSASAAVLFLSPWGLEEMFTRKVWRTMAEAFAEVGISSLRFDYPGTGDALDRTNYAGGLEIWIESAVAAVEQLKARSGCERIIVVSQGLGAAIAPSLADRIRDLQAIAFLAPVTSGRAYVRELQFWSRMIDDGLGLSEDQRQKDGVAIASLGMPSEIASDVRAINLSILGDIAVKKCLVASRGDRPSDEAFSGQLRALGAEVDEIKYVGYDVLVSNPSVSTVPHEVVGKIVAWAQAIAGERTGLNSISSKDIPISSSLDGVVFHETPVTFGDNNRLYGIVCEPHGQRRGATAILLGTAYDRNAGWGRMGVSMARQLASEGIATLRFDAANVADSPPCDGVSDQVLYNDAQLIDIHEAVSFIAKRLPGQIVLTGRCSSGYQAFKAAVGDQRIRGVVLVNPYVFEWDPSTDVDESLVAPPRSLDTYKQRLFQRETFLRLISGRIDVRKASINVLKALGKRLSHLARPVLHLLPGVGEAHRRVEASFKTLATRNVALDILYSENDVGCDHLVRHFGEGGAALRKYSNVQLEFIPGSDHNLTPENARQRYIDAVRNVALKVGS